MASGAPRWDVVTDYSREQRVLATVAANLMEHCSDLVPGDAMQPLRDYRHALTARNLVLSVELLQVLSGLEERGIFALPFKGPVLAEEVYGGLGLREFSDLDILVAAHDLGAALDLLMERDYRPLVTLNRAQLVAFARGGHHLVLMHQRHGITLELHWEMSGRYTRGPITLDRLQPAIRSSSLLGRPIHSLDPEFLLVYLCVHGGREYWRTLAHVGCVAELIEAYPNLDWDVVMSWAERLGMVRQTKLGLSLAGRLWDTAVPQKDMDRALAAVADQVALELSTRRTLTGVSGGAYRAYVAYHRSTMDDSLGFVRQCLRPVFAATYADWEAPWRVPARFAGLHLVLRPLRLFYKYVRRSTGRVDL